MQTDLEHPTEVVHAHRKQRHLAERFEGYVGVAMVLAIIVLGVALIYGVMSTGSTTPAWMR
jgi:hypothetical protein